MTLEIVIVIEIEIINCENHANKITSYKNRRNSFIRSRVKIVIAGINTVIMRNISI